MKRQTKSYKQITSLLAEAEPWLDRLAAQGRSPITIRDYRFVVRRFSQFLSRDGGIAALRNVQQPHLEAWLRLLTKAKLSPVTVGCYLHPLLGLFAWLEQRGEIFLNPCSDLLLPKIPRRLMPVVSEAEMLRLMNSVRGESQVELRDRAILEVAYATGLRCRELAGLNLDSIDLAEGVVQTLGKGGTERNGLLTQAASDAVRRYLAQGRPGFVIGEATEAALWLGVNSGRRIAAPMLRRVVKKRANAIGLRLTPHGIRRAFATHLLRNGASPLQLRRLLGHISYQHLRHYLRYAPEELLATHRRSCLGA